jgi:hypothetical protein
MPKRRTKKQRKEAERRRKERRDSKRAEEMAGVLAALGVLKEFRKQPAPLRKRFSRLRYPRPEIVFDAAAENEPEAPEIANDLSKTLDMPYLVNEKTVRTISLLDFFCIGVPLWHYFGLTNLGTTGIEKADHFLNCMYTATNDHIADNLDSALGSLVSNLEYGLLKYSRIDSKLFWTSLDFPPIDDPHPNYFFKVTVHVQRADGQRREIDGVPKRLYRCGAAVEEEIDWISWTPEDLGLTGSEEALPVFIDGGHALRNLRERVTIAQENGVVEDCIWASLQSPEVVRREGEDEFLVEYRLFEQKLGYFVFKALDDMYVAKTFLFLTMDGTPEGQKLWEKLRLTKKDKQYTGLDRLSTFVLSDMKDDPELVAVFEECGCAHLFNITEEELTDRQLRGSAEDVRKYLGNRLDRAVREIRQRSAGVRDE